MAGVQAETKQEREIKNILKARPIDVDDLSSPAHGDGTRDKLSKMLRKLARMTGDGEEEIIGENFCPLELLVFLLTTNSDVPEDIDDYDGSSNYLFDYVVDMLADEREEYTLRDFTTSSNNNSEHAKKMAQIGLSMLDPGKSGVSPTEWVDRIEELQDLYARSMTLPKSELQALATQLVENAPDTHEPIIRAGEVLNFIMCSGDGNNKHSAAQRLERQRILNELRRFLNELMQKNGGKKFNLDPNDSDGIGANAGGGAENYVDRHKLQKWLRTNLELDLTAKEIEGLLKEMNGDENTTVYESHFSDFLVMGNIRSRQPERASDNWVVVDIQVGPDRPEGGEGLTYKCVTAHQDTRPRQGGDQDGVDVNMGGWRARSSIKIWYLRERKAQEGRSTRLMPIVDVKLEPEAVSNTMVTAGYVCCATNLDNSVTKTGKSTADRHRYLWFRRALNPMEARDHAITDLKFTCGNKRDPEDRMHAPPVADQRFDMRDMHWAEAQSRQQGSMPLRRVYGATVKIWTEDLKLWIERATLPGVSQLEDRPALCAFRWNTLQKDRELELAVRRAFRQRQLAASGTILGGFTPSVVNSTGGSARFDLRDENLREPPNFPGLFNDFLPRDYAKLPRSAWCSLLNSVGVTISVDKADLLMRRISSRDVSTGVEREEFVAFMTKTDFELEETELHLKTELRRRYRISGSKPREKEPQLRRLENLLQNACVAIEGTVQRRTNGIAMKDFAFLLKCIDEHLTDSEQTRLVLRFDPDFKGLVDVKKLIEFVGNDSHEVRERAERVYLAAQTLCEFIQECGRPGNGMTCFGLRPPPQGRAETPNEKFDQAWARLMKRRRERLQRHYYSADPRAAVRRIRRGMGIRDVDLSRLDPEDLVMAVESRSGQQLGARGCGVRLSPHEARQLVMFIAPRSRDGWVTEEQYRRFFKLDTMSTVQIYPRPLGELLEVLADEKFLGTVLRAYHKWYKGNADYLKPQLVKDKKVDSNVDDLAGQFYTARDKCVEALIQDNSANPERSRNHPDPVIPLERFVEMDFRSPEGGTERPFADNASEAALVAMHVGADHITEEGDEVRHCVKLRSFIEGVCRLIYGNVETVEQKRITMTKRVTGSAVQMYVVCEDLRREIKDKSMVWEQGRRPDYLGWLLVSMSEFQVGSEEERAIWCNQSRASGVPVSQFRQLLQHYNKVFGWELDSKRIEEWANEFDTDGDHYVRPAEIDDFMRGTSKAAHTKVEEKKAKKKMFQFDLGDELANKFVKDVAGQLAARKTLAEGIDALHQAFDRIDGFPHKGVVSFPQFRKSCEISGAFISHDSDHAITHFFNNREDRMIDYEYFIQSVRRAWLDHDQAKSDTLTGSAKLDEKLEKLRKALQKLAKEDNDRFAPSKVFHKMDKDLDGKLTKDEFKDGLKSLNCDDIFNDRDYEPLFRYFDDDGDHTIDYEEFYEFLVEGKIGRRIQKKGRRLHTVDADDDGDSIFDEEMPRYDHFKDVRVAVDKEHPSKKQRQKLADYLKRKDQKDDGTVSEAAFLRFLDKARLQDRLTRKQIQTLINHLDPKHTHWIRYEDFVRKVIDFNDETLTSESRRHKHHANVEPIIWQIQDVVQRAMQMGQQPHSLFYDASGRGLVEKYEAERALRSMGCNLSETEFKTLCHALPRRDDYQFDYHELFHKLRTTNSRFGPPPNLPATLFPVAPGRLGTPFGYNENSMYGVPPGAMQTYPMSPTHMMPVGGAVNPMMSNPMMNNPAYWQQQTGMMQFDDSTFNSVVDKVRYASTNQMSSWGHNYSLSRIFEGTYDTMGTGMVSVINFQNALSQLGLSLSAIEIQSLQRRLDRHGNGTLDWKEFCRLVETGGQSTDLHSITLECARKLSDQRRRGTNIILCFEMHDVRSTGILSHDNFQISLQQLGIQLSPFQMQTLCNRFAEPGSLNLVNYRDFLQHINRSEPGSMLLDLDSSRRNASSFDFDDRRSRSFEAAKAAAAEEIIERLVDKDRSGFRTVDGFRDVSRHSLTGFGNVTGFGDDFLNRTSTFQAQTALARHSFDEGSGYGGLSPRVEPAVSRHARLETIHSGRRYGGSSGSPVRDDARRLWGHDVPLGSRGELPEREQQRLDASGKWMCMVCFYNLNSKDRSHCEMCLAPRPNKRSETSEADFVREAPGTERYMMANSGRRDGWQTGMEDDTASAFEDRF